jgi:quercetin dioxygenase-like cupin family protein
MSPILAIPREGFPEQMLGGGVIRWTSPDLYEQHKAQISFVQHPPDREIEAHSHTVDEVIYVLDGVLETGGRSYRKGSLLFIGANTVYGFRSGLEGLRWVFFRPNRPEVDIAASDIRPAAETTSPESRAELLRAEEIERKPWREVGEAACRERPVMTSPGNPRVSFFTVGAGNNVPETALRPRFLYVLEGVLRAGEQSCGPEGVISVPAGTTYTARADSGSATYLLVEGAR